jgi:hypothetical protein
MRAGRYQARATNALQQSGFFGDALANLYPRLQHPIYDLRGPGFAQAADAQPDLVFTVIHQNIELNTGKAAEVMLVKGEEIVSGNRCCGFRP